MSLYPVPAAPWLLPLALAGILVSPSFATAGDLKMQISPSFSHGTYGSDVSTDTFTLPLRIRYREGPFKVAIRIPYLSVTGPRSPVPNVGVVGSPGNNRATIEGLGDLGLSAAARVLGGQEGDSFKLELGVGTKLPTGNRARGLGSGQVGLSVQIETTFNVTQDVSLELTTGRFFRTRQGDNRQLRDFLYNSMTLNYEITPTMTVGMTLDVQERAVSSGTAVLEAGLFVEYEIAPKTRIGASLFKGFTRDSSAYGISLLLSHRFSI